METTRFKDIVPDVPERKPRDTAEWATYHLVELKKENERLVAAGKRPLRKRRGFCMGVDLGQANDYTAIVLLERVVVTHTVGVSRPGPDERGHNDFDTWKLAEETTDEWHIRFAERFRASYVDVTARILDGLSSEKLKGSETSVIVDATGVGRPIIDMMRADKLNPVPVIITGGNSVTREDGFWHVPKRDLVGAVKAVLGKGQLKIAEGIPFQDVLIRELQNFHVKVNIVTGHDSYEAWREREHDDLVLATALACWYALKQKKHAPLVAPIIGKIAPRERMY